MFSDQYIFPQLLGLADWMYAAIGEGYFSLSICLDPPRSADTGRLRDEVLLEVPKMGKMTLSSLR